MKRKKTQNFTHLPRPFCDHDREDKNHPSYCYYKLCAASVYMSGPVMTPAKAPLGLFTSSKKEFGSIGHQKCDYIVQQKKIPAQYKRENKSSCIKQRPSASIAKDPNARSLPPCPVKYSLSQEPLYSGEMQAAKDKLASFRHKMNSVDRSSIEKETKTKHVKAMVTPVMKLLVHVDYMEKAENRIERIEELQWLYSQIGSLLKNINCWLAGEKKAPKRCRGPKKFPFISLPTKSFGGKTRNTVQPKTRYENKLDLHGQNTFKTYIFQVLCQPGKEGGL